MKYTIEGLSQAYLIENDMDCTDAVLIRYILDFYNTDKMSKINAGGVEYFWLKYDYVIEQLPIIGIKSRDGLYRRMKKYSACGLMSHHTKKQGGTFSCYRFNSNELSSMLGKQSDRSDQKSEGYGLEVGGGTDEKSEQKTLLSEETNLSEHSITNKVGAKAPEYELTHAKHIESSNQKQKEKTAEQDKDNVPLESGNQSVIEELVELFNKTGLRKARKMTAARRRSINARIKEYSVEEIKDVFEMVKNSKFLTGQKDGPWKPGLDWLMNPTNFLKVLEGNFEDHDPKKLAYTEDFETWWKQCGRGSKANAFKRWKEQTDKPSVDELIAIHKNYSNHCAAKERSLKDSEGWINGRFWETNWLIDLSTGQEAKILKEFDL